MEVPQLLKQYKDIKEHHKDHIVFFRLGDFYEMFFEDAVTASKELELTLTAKNFGGGTKAPMCGVPQKSYEIYVGRLIKKGYKVAIAEQMEPSSKGAKLVSRQVVRVVTPGTIIENSLLEEGQNNYICCMYISGAQAGIVFCDVSTGEFSLSEISGEDISNAIINELSRFLPKEILVNEGIANYKQIVSFIQRTLPACTEQLPENQFSTSINTPRVLEHFKKNSLDELGLTSKPLATCAAGVMLGYIYKTQRIGVERINTIDLYADTHYMNLDVNARKNLELTETIRSGEFKGSLLWVLDKTKTSMGKRLFKNYITQPLVNPVVINKRLDAVGELKDNVIVRGDLRDLLSNVHDLQRLMTRIVYGNTTPREMKSLSYTCGMIPDIKLKLRNIDSQLLRMIYKELDELTDIQEMLVC